MKKRRFTMLDEELIRLYKLASITDPLDTKYAVIQTRIENLETIKLESTTRSRPWMLLSAVIMPPVVVALVEKGGVLFSKNVMALINKPTIPK